MDELETKCVSWERNASVGKEMREFGTKCVSWERNASVGDEMRGLETKWVSWDKMGELRTQWMDELWTKCARLGFPS